MATGNQILALDAGLQLLEWLLKHPSSVPAWAEEIIEGIDMEDVEGARKWLEEGE